jgi:cell division protein FtsL
MARAAAAVAEPATTAGRAAPAAPSRRRPARRAPAPAKQPSRRASGKAAPSRAPGKTAPRRAPGKAAPRAAARRARPRSAAGRVALPLGARMLDALLSGRVWIGLVGVLLAGIVFFNVDLLRMNREITQMADRAAQLKRENGRLREDVAGLANSERIQQAAAGLGLVLPAPAEVRYLKSNPLVDARTASKRIIAPTPALAPDPVVAETPTTTTTTTPTTTTTTTPPTTTAPPATTTAAAPTG